MPAVRAVLLSALLATASAAPARAAYVFPTPKSVSASPLTEISIRGIAPTEIGRITVEGSRSGRHTGRMQAHSDGQGASWIPSRRFRGGEKVTVRTGFSVANAENGDFSFRTAIWPGGVRISANETEVVVKPGKVRRFKTRPDLIPPYLTVERGSAPAEPGYMFLSPKAKNDTLQAGPMIADVRGRPIWFRPLPSIRAATDLRVQTYQGDPVLTWWEGTSRQGMGRGEFVIAGQDYRILKRVRLPSGYRGDLHEFLITPQDTALVISYPVVKADLSGEGGSRNGQLVDAVVQEIDIATGRMLFEWHSRGTIPLAHSYIAPERSAKVPWDYVHVNSVALDNGGAILVSGRNTWGVYKLSRQSAKIEWTLGGRNSTFKLGRGARFAWQHDARQRADGAITMFDNSASPAVAQASRGVVLRLNERARTASLISAVVHPRRLLAATQGNYQALPSGGALVGWGSRRYMTEYDSVGNILWDARLSVGFESYRAYRYPWVGRPATLPQVVARRGRSGMSVYASWNGATEVANWEVRGGSSRTRLRSLAVYARTGFESRIPIAGRTTYVAVVALNKEGAPLGRSSVVRLTG